MQRIFKARHAQAVKQASAGITGTVQTVTVQKGRKRVQRVVVDAPDGDMAILKISVGDATPIGGW